MLAAWAAGDATTATLFGGLGADGVADTGVELFAAVASEMHESAGLHGRAHGFVKGNLDAATGDLLEVPFAGAVVPDDFAAAMGSCVNGAIGAHAASSTSSAGHNSAAGKPRALAMREA
jgi:hypothetical protein